VVLISGQTDLLDRSVHFLLRPDHADFRATGLSRECYIAANRVYQISLENVIKSKGRLTGALADDFQRWFG
jgi:hypothetical protein